MKVIVLTRGGLPEKLLEMRLNWQKSAEVIVSRRFGRRAEQQRFWKLEGFEGDTKKADNFMWT